MFGGVNRARRCRCGLILIINFLFFFFYDAQTTEEAARICPEPLKTKQSIN